ncbi:MAG: UDP-N-acetylmuramoyl-L-alanyl-D-glutamate--2,6-diaminopimelate ligase [Actinomycetota bacterium]
MATSPERPLSQLAAAAEGSEVRGDGATAVSGLCLRSTEASAGDLFFCVPGLRVDGHAFAADAAGRGAAALVVERWLDVALPQVRVASVRGAMGPIADAFHGHPSRAFPLVGVTGTNGKTTTTYLLESVFRAAGLVPGVIGTTGVRIAGEPQPFPRTTPEAPDLQRLLATMVGRGVGAAAMEVSSHGLEQRRVDGTRFACAVFTNLSQDHLDYHPTMEDYFAAKARLFEPGRASAAVVNVDDAYGRRLVDRGIPTTTYAIDAAADLRAADVRTTEGGSTFVVDGLRVATALRGRFNVENCLAAIGAARALGIADATAVAGIEAVRGVPGRVEAVDAGQPFLVLVDYAHTPDGIDNVLRAARPLAAGRVLIVFGCGGDRDRAKRPRMGEAATRGADLAIVTSDNPRSEDPLAIVEEILPGARAGGGSFLVEPDRRAAIRLALGEARPGDVVVIAGKGHESGQEFADRTLPFDDREVALEELRASGVAP